MSVKALLKEFFSTEDFKRSRKVARVRVAKVADLKGRIAAFLRGDLGLDAFADSIRAAVDDHCTAEAGLVLPVWGFGGPGTGQFVTALLSAAPPQKIEAELSRALTGLEVSDPSDRLRTFAAFVARTARDLRLGPESHLHVGYATCFISFLWHALYDLQVPVFYGASHRGVKALIESGAIEDPEYGSRDLAERFRAFLRIARSLLDLVSKVNPQLNPWTVDAFLEWAAQQQEQRARAAGGAAVPGQESLSAIPSEAPAGAQSARGDTVRGTPFPRTLAEMRVAAADLESQEPVIDASHMPEPESRPATPVRLGKLAPGEEHAKTARRTRGAGAAAPPAEAPEPPGLPPGPPGPGDAGPTLRPGEDVLQALARETRFPERLLRDLESLLLRFGQVAIEGPTGVGKTFLARRFAVAFAGSGERVRYIQLHPSYRYEDFLEAPGPAGGAAVPGVFKTFARRAAGDPDRRHVVVLDELGQTEAIKLLGEVYSLLEYRDEEVILPFSREQFRIPKNLYMIAAASTAQGSRTLEDAALRRRFHFLHLDPSAEVLKGWLEQNRPAFLWVADLFAELNRRLVREGGARAQVGHSLFMRPELDEQELERIFAYDVRPLVAMAVREDSKAAAKFDLAALRKAIGEPAPSEAARG